MDELHLTSTVVTCTYRLLRHCEILHCTYSICMGLVCLLEWTVIISIHGINHSVLQWRCVLLMMH